MIKLAIRDDDLNFFSKVDELERLYAPINEFPISYALIPYVTDVSAKGKCPETKGNKDAKWFGDNEELLAWLKRGLEDKKLDVLMHGITHEYHFDSNNCKIPEMIWRDDVSLSDTIGKIKVEMAECLNHGISVFVAPANKISYYGMQCVINNAMDYSGIIPASFNRKITIKNCWNYLYRWGFRFIYRLPYPNVMRYSDHNEINACSLQGYDYLLKMFNCCKKIGSPMVVNVHYWHLRDNGNAREELFDFIKYALNNGAEPTTVSELIKSKI